MTQNISQIEISNSGKMTPMMEQFVEIKAANPDSLLFYRMGDFYELFFEDAQIASRALGIALTKRGKHLGEDIPMCGVPFHAADDYLMKLIKLGHRVSVCEQLENPIEAKKRGSKSVVKRGVVRLVTPGTLTDDKLLDPGRSNFLCALSRINKGGRKQEMALSWIDMSTGHFRTKNTSAHLLASDISAIEPSEIIVSQNTYEQTEISSQLDSTSISITPLPGNLFDSGQATKSLCAYYAVKSIDGFGTFSASELAAAAAILAYVEKTQIAEKPALSIPRSLNDTPVMLIDAATRANLELTKTLSGEREGSLLKAIDRTLTSSGSRELVNRLMAPLTATEIIEARLDSVEFLANNPNLLESIRNQLKQIPDLARAISRLAVNRGGPRDINALLCGFTNAEGLKNLLPDETSLPSEIKEISDLLQCIPKAVIELLQRALAQELPLLARDGGFIAEDFNAELDELRILRTQSRKVISGFQAQYAKQSNIKNLKIKHNNVLGYFIEVTANNAEQLQKDNQDEKFIHRQTLANVMRFTTTELAEIESKIANANGRSLEIELRIFEELRQELIANGQKITSLADTIAALDIAASQAKLAIERNYCRPQITRSLEFELTNARHPVIEQVLEREASNPFIANSCNLGPVDEHSQGSIWLLTGPNMGGKSTFLRQNAVIALLAQMGGFVPADTAKIGIVDRLFSRVGASDDLARGRSTFMVEMVETAVILNQATEKSLVILDEIGRGTATFDGLSIAWAAIEHLHEVNKCRTIFATHFHELVALAEPLARLSNVTIKVKEWQGDVIFLHEVIAGAADQSYGIQVAKLAGLPPEVIARARAVLDQLEGFERQNASQKIIDDLPLFSVDQKSAAKPANLEKPIVKALRSVSPDELSPRDALEKLYELRSLLPDDEY